MASGVPFYSDPTFWVAGSFTVFVGAIVVKGGLKKIGEMLDEKGKKIAAQIEEAKSLRDEAEALLTEYQRRQRDGEKEAAEIMARAKEDAGLLVEQAKKEVEDLTRRRTRSAEEKIAQAEIAAVKSVRSAAIDVAIDATRQVLASELKGDAGKKLVDVSINDIGGKLH